MDTMKLRILVGFSTTLLIFLVLMSGCIQEKAPQDEKIKVNETNITKEEAIEIALNDSRVIARIGNHTFNVSENDVSVAVLNEKELYLVNVNIYNGKLFGIINVFVTYDGHIETVLWEYPPPNPPYIPSN